MTWFDFLKGLTPEERRQTRDFWPPEDMPLTWNKSKWSKQKRNAYQRLTLRNPERQPTKEELEEEMKNPTRIRFNPRNLRREMRKKPEYISAENRYNVLEYPKDWKDNMRLRPNNYEKINNIAIYLRTWNKPINRQSILEEIDGNPTNEDNLAIEYFLKELEQ